MTEPDPEIVRQLRERLDAVDKIEDVRRRAALREARTIGKRNGADPRPDEVLRLAAFILDGQRDAQDERRLDE